MKKKNRAKIRAIGLDCYGTAILRNRYYKNPYRELIGTLVPRLHRETALQAMRPVILKDGIELGEIPERLQEMGFPISSRLVGDAVLNAKDMMRAECEDGYVRNPELDSFLENAKECGLKVAIVSDLGRDYGAIADRLTGDIATRVYSFEIGADKKEGYPFQHLAKELQCETQEIAFIGNTLADDVIAPMHEGMPSFWYRKNGQEGLSKQEFLYRDTIVSDLNDGFMALMMRGYQLR